MVRFAKWRARENFVRISVCGVKVVRVLNLETFLDIVHQLLFTNIHRPPPLVLPETAFLSCRYSV